MTDTTDALTALSGPRLSLRGTLPSVPHRPGLYAVHGDECAWTDLGLAPPSGGPLYVGKAEDSLSTRDLNTHFGNGRTGSSTVRRSFAALLREQLELTGIPRNPANPGHFSCYGLSPDDDQKLTEWMTARLGLAVWVTDGTRPLADVERDVLRLLNPPINIAGVTHRWQSRLQAQRRVMADQARAWRPAPYPSSGSRNNI